MFAETVEAYGQTWHRYPQSSRRSDREYYKRGTVWLHRYTWERERGEIPAGMVIHHKDGNCQNNAIENLECVSQKQHRAKHPFEGEQLEKQRAHMARIRPSAGSSPRPSASPVRPDGMKNSTFTARFMSAPPRFPKIISRCCCFTITSWASAGSRRGSRIYICLCRRKDSIRTYLFPPDIASPGTAGLSVVPEPRICSPASVSVLQGQ